MKSIKKLIMIGLASGLFIGGVLVLLAYSNTWGKTEIEFKIHINEQLVLESVFGESPTFAIWLEDPDTGKTQTAFVTSRAGLDDWEGKAEVPVALPKWFEIDKIEKQNMSIGSESGVDSITGATPKPGYFTTRVRVEPGSKWNCWIEMNLAGDYNDHYKEYDEVSKTTDTFATGQPALVYKTEIEAVKGNSAVPRIAGMSILNSGNGQIIQPLQGITSATDIFDEIKITVVAPKPKIIK